MRNIISAEPAVRVAEARSLALGVVPFQPPVSWEFCAPGVWAHRLSPAFPSLVLEAAYSLSPSASLHLELWGLSYGSPWSWGAPAARRSPGKDWGLSSRWGGHSSALGFGRFSFLA